MHYKLNSLPKQIIPLKDSFMEFQLRLLCFWTLLLSPLISCHCHNLTVYVAGTIYCITTATGHEEHPELHVTVHCNFQSRVHGTSSVDKKGKFNVTLSAEMMEDKNNSNKPRCYATLQGALTTQCPIHKARTASMKNLSFHHGATQTLDIIHTPIVFSPLTCQSAFFWPFFKFPPTPEFMLPPITYTPPEQLSPLPSRSTTPLIPSLPPGTATEFPPTHPPSGQECIPPSEPPMPSPVYETPPFSPPPIPVYETPFHTPIEKLSPPPPTHYRKPNPIPQPPPVPLLPPKPKSRF